MHIYDLEFIIIKYEKNRSDLANKSVSPLIPYHNPYIMVTEILYFKNGPNKYLCIFVHTAADPIYIFTKRGMMDLCI